MKNKGYAFWLAGLLSLILLINLLPGAVPAEASATGDNSGPPASVEVASSTLTLISTINLRKGGDGPADTAVNTSTNRIYVANSDSNNISVLDGSDNSFISTVNVGDAPEYIAVNSNTNRIYVANYSSNSISVINGVTNAVIKTIGVKTTPSDIAVNPVTNRIYQIYDASYDTANFISVLDGATNKVIATIYVEDDFLSNIAVNPLTNRIYVTTLGDDDKVLVIDGAANNVIGSVKLESQGGAIAVNPDANYIYVCSPPGDNIFVLDGTDNSIIASIPVGEYPLDVAVNPLTNRVYVVNNFSGDISVIDGASNSVLTTPDIGEDPGSIAVNSTTNLIYTTSVDQKCIKVIDGSNDSVKATLESSTGSGAADVALNLLTNHIYVANAYSDDVSVINGATGEVESTLEIGLQPCDIAVNPETSRIYVANSESQDISVIDGATGSVMETIDLKDHPLNIAVNPVTNRIYVGLSKYDKQIAVIDGFDNSLIATIDIGSYPWGIALNPFTNRIYVANQKSGGTVSVIDGSNNTVVDMVKVGGAPRGIAVNTFTNCIYVCNVLSSSVSVIDGSNDNVIDEINLESGVLRIAVNPANSRIYVVNGISDGIYVIDGATDNLIGELYLGEGVQDVAANPSSALAYVTNRRLSTLSIFQDIPPAPTGLAAALKTDKLVQLIWNMTASDINGFYIERKKHTDTAFKQIGKTGADASTYIDKTGLKALTAYDYRVCAYLKGAGNSAYSDIITATTLSTPPKPPKLSSPKNNAAGLDLAPTLEWSAPAGAVYYTLEVSTEKKFTTFTLDQSGLTETSYSIPEGAVEWNTTYYWRVKASGSDGSTSKPSSVSKFKTAIGTAPTGLAATPLAYNQVSLTWNMTGYDVTGYYIERKKTTETKFKQTGKTGADITTYPDKSGLKASLEYEYRVCSYLKGAGNSLYSDIVSVTTLSTPPKAPKLKSPKNNATGLGLTPTLEWTAPEGAASYTLEIAKDQKFTAIIRNEKGLYVNQYTIPYVPVDPEGKNLEGNTTYYWRVNARGSDGSPSNWSSVRKFKTASVPLPEVAPGGLTATVVSDRQIDLSWTANAANADGVCIERKIITDTEYTQIARLEAAIISYSDNEVDANNAYSYRIRAYNAGGYSDYSEAAPAITPPAVPGLILPVDGAQITGNTPTLSWSQPSGWWKFNLQVSAAEDFSAPEIDNKTVGAWYDVQNNELAAHTVYYWRVSATNNLGATSAWSAYRSFLTGEGVDTQPPVVKERSPEEGTTSVPVTAAVKATFSEPMLVSSISTDTFYLKEGSTWVEGTVSYNDSGQTATFTPSADLLPDTVYTATVTAGVQDLAGNHQPQNITWTFSTGEGVMVSIPDYAAPAGGTLDVNLNISPVSGLNGYQIVMEYDPAVLEIMGEEGDTAVGVTKGLIGTTEVPLDGWTFVKDENGVVIPGQVLFIGYFTGGRTATGAGYLAQVHFNILGPAGASSPLNFTARGTPGYILYLPSSIIDKDAKAIPCTFVNGAVNVIPQIAAQMLP